jgi:hypothetical protein
VFYWIVFIKKNTSEGYSRSNHTHRTTNRAMRNLLRAVAAGYGAKKLSGGRCGCIGTFLLFILLYVLLGPIFNMF